MATANPLPKSKSKKSDKSFPFSSGQPFVKIRVEVKKKNRLKKLWRFIGPGFITGASDDDPTAIATYTQAGAQFGYGQLWTTLFTFPFMAVIQDMCGRIGMVTGKGLAGVIRKNYSRRALSFAVFLLLIANTINIGADLGAMAISAQLLYDLPFAFWLITLTFLILLMEAFLSYRVYSRFLKYLALTLLTYVAVAFLVGQNWSEVAWATLIPNISFKEVFLLNLLAILGTNISPYLFFWQASEEVEEEVETGRLRTMGRGVPKVSNRNVRDLHWDTAIGMFFSNVIVFFICLTAASTLGRHGIMNVTTSAEAAQALEPIAGRFATILFAVGVLGSGLLAVPVLSGSASYALSESFGWHEGLYCRFKKALGFYGVMTIATLVGLLINFTSIPPFKMLIYSAALNGLLAPPLLIYILIIANNRRIMGKYTNKFLTNSLGILITALMSLAAIIFVWQLFV
jgi:NRAMP (natural resistance-associated macrophage protein)-like metal ion transporter